MAHCQRPVVKSKTIWCFLIDKENKQGWLSSQASSVRKLYRSFVTALWFHTVQRVTHLTIIELSLYWKFFKRLVAIMAWNRLQNSLLLSSQRIVERFNKRIVTRLVHYVKRPRAYWDHYVQLLINAYKGEVHWSTGSPPIQACFITRLADFLHHGCIFVSTNGCIEGAKHWMCPSFCTQTIMMLKICAVQILESAPEWYINYFDNSILATEAIHLVHSEFVDRRMNNPRQPFAFRMSCASKFSENLAHLENCLTHIRHRPH